MTQDFEFGISCLTKFLQKGKRVAQKDEHNIFRKR